MQKLHFKKQRSNTTLYSAMLHSPSPCRLPFECKMLLLHPPHYLILHNVYCMLHCSAATLCYDSGPPCKTPGSLLYRAASLARPTAVDFTRLDYSPASSITRIQDHIDNLVSTCQLLQDALLTALDNYIDRRKAKQRAATCSALR